MVVGWSRVAQQTTWTEYRVSLNLNRKTSTAPGSGAQAQVHQSQLRRLRTVLSRDAKREREGEGAAHGFLLLQKLVLESGFDLVLRKETSPSRY